MTLKCISVSIFSLFIVFFIYGCNNANNKAISVKYIVPNNYEGFNLIKFTGDKVDKKGDDIAILLSSTGTTIAPVNYDPNDKRAIISAEYENGDPITCEYNINKEQIGLWPVTTSSDGLLILVGKEEAKKISYRQTSALTIEQFNKIYKEQYKKKKQDESRHTTFER